MRSRPCAGALFALAAVVAFGAVPAWARSAASARARAAKLAVSRGSHAPYHVSTRRFDVEFSVPTAVGRSYAILCERAYKAFCRKFGVSPGAQVWEGTCHVYIFAERDEFVSFATRVHQFPSANCAGGYARIRRDSPAIVLYLDDGDHRRLKHVLVHEMTHVFLQLFRRDVKIHTWLHEGWAQYFEFSYDPRHSRLAQSRARIKKLVRRKAHTPLSRFWTMTFPASDLDSYAQAWSLVDFMVRKGSAKKAGQFVLALKNGLGQDEALEQAFGCSRERFEALWKRYVAQEY